FGDVAPSVSQSALAEARIIDRARAACVDPASRQQVAAGETGSRLVIEPQPVVAVVVVRAGDRGRGIAQGQLIVEQQNPAGDVPSRAERVAQLREEIGVLRLSDVGICRFLKKVEMSSPDGGQPRASVVVKAAAAQE